jgi:hypothetical protein
MAKKKPAPKKVESDSGMKHLETKEFSNGAVHEVYEDQDGKIWREIKPRSRAKYRHITAEDGSRTLEKI